ncbi:MAG: DUF4416 family protein [Pirellulaceae bacterium]|nr:DUF4416 family protein [Pirellulaceae bacterium]
MAEIRSARPVVMLIAVCSRYEQALDWAAQRAETEFGPIELRSPAFEFNQTEYYQASMGAGLKKQFLALRRLIDPGQLRHVKRSSNGWEIEYAKQTDWPEERPLNLDPGYVSEAKLVLASTKDHSHRIYLDDGIYAEVTLHYRGGRWQKSAWTYPDYQQADFQEFFLRCRDFLRLELRQ